MKKNTWAFTNLVLLSFLFCFFTELSPRPGMGGSYRSSSSSSSSSSSYRSSSSSYRSNSSSSSNSNSSSSYTSSGPEPTSYFTSKNQQISIHFNADGSAHVIEKFVVIQNTAQVGIVRKKFPEIFDWEVENIKVTPNEYVTGNLPHQIYLLWTKGKNDVDLPIEIEYDIKNGIEFLGDLPIAFWTFSRNSKEPYDQVIQITWDPSIVWKKLELKQKRFDQNISDYVTEEIKFDIIEFGLTLVSSSLHEDYRDIILTGFLDESNNLAQNHKTKDTKKNYYHLKQTTKINYNTSNDHSGSILIPTENQISDLKPSLDFEYGFYLDNTSGSFFSFLFPTYQFVYGFSDSLASSFWSLHYAIIDQVPEKRIINNKEYYTYDVAYSKLGEHKQSQDNNREIIQIIPMKIRYENHSLGSFSLEFLFPENLDLSSTSVKMFITDCSYCTTFNPSLSLPIEIGKDKNRILVNWESPLPTGYFPIIQIETDKTLFSSSYFFTYLSSLRSLFLSPGSGTNIGYMFFSTLFFSLPFLIGFIFYRVRKNNGARKRKLSNITKSIQEFDPNFDISHFLNKSKLIADKVVSAWCDGDMNPARYFISSGIFQRFQIQLKLLKEIDEIKNIMEGFQVVEQEILMTSVYNDYLTVHVKMKCQTKDLNVPISFNKQQIDDSLKQTSLGSYDEIYSFSRKISAKSELGKDLFNNACPSCGASSPYSHISNKCQFCGSIFNSGEADWVLSEITQMIEWKPERYKTDEDFASEHNSIPTSIQIIEDRASALLWKWVYAKTKGSPSFLKRESLSEALLANLKSKEIFYIPVVGSAEIKEIQKLGNEFLAEVIVHWSFARSKKAMAENKRTSIKLRLKGNRDSKIGFSEVSCKNCGGLFPEIDSVQCSYCGEPIPLLVSDWLLESIH